MKSNKIIAAACMVSCVIAAPAPEPTPAPDPIAARAGIPGIINYTQLNSSSQAAASTAGSSFAAAWTNIFKAITPSATPTNAAAAFSTMSSLASAYPSAPLAAGGAILLSGLSGYSNNPFADANDVLAFGPCNGNNFTNPPPPQPIYPKKGANDAPYSQPESALRADIYFPPGFTYGKVRPAIFIPGTGGESCEAFANNLGKLFTGSSYADPVYVNLPMNSLGDSQVSSEYVAYAINYITAVTNSNVTVLAWSQGSISTQWALKYWPSTRSNITSFIALSGDYHGTVLAPLLCPPGDPCSPAVLQQYYTSNYIKRLRMNGGDSSFVPTTNIHSIFDEIVEPQQQPIASGELNNANGAGVTNVQIESVCPPSTPAGFLKFGHEATLYNPVTFAVAKDAILNNGTGNIARSGASSQCGTYYTNGLSLGDVFATEFLIPLAGFNIETYNGKVTSEPPTASYATY